MESWFNSAPSSTLSTAWQPTVGGSPPSKPSAYRLLTVGVHPRSPQIMGRPSGACAAKFGLHDVPTSFTPAIGCDRTHVPLSATALDPQMKGEPSLLKPKANFR